MILLTEKQLLEQKILNRLGVKTYDLLNYLRIEKLRLIKVPIDNGYSRIYLTNTDGDIFIQETTYNIDLNSENKRYKDSYDKYYRLSEYTKDVDAFVSQGGIPLVFNTDEKDIYITPLNYIEYYEDKKEIDAFSLKSMLIVYIEKIKKIEMISQYDVDSNQNLFEDLFANFMVDYTDVNDKWRLLEWKKNQE